MTRRLLPALALALALAATPAHAAPLTVAQQHALIAIRDAASYYGVSYGYLVAVAQCESGLDPQAYNDASGASGLFQFEYLTWITTAHQLDQIKGRDNAWASAFEAARLIAHGEAWRWTCG